jgi:flagellar basal-body rod protein FlgG
MRALWISGSGLEADEKRMELIANNMANINTTGYKFQVAFGEELSQIQDDGRNTSYLPAGTKVSFIGRDFTQGQLESTGRPLDIAINGDGFIEVLLPDESIAYTRSGELTIDANGSIVTKNGYKIFPEITVPQGAVQIAISANGEIIAKLSNGRLQSVGTLELAKFVNPNGLKNIGSGMYVATEASGEPIVDAPGKQGIGTLMQGFLEKSNVSLVNEMIKMMLTQKSYEINAKVLQTTDQMMGIANGIKR